MANNTEQEGNHNKGHHSFLLTDNFNIDPVVPATLQQYTKHFSLQDSPRIQCPNETARNFAICWDQ